MDGKSARNVHMNKFTVLNGYIGVRVRPCIYKVHRTRLSCILFQSNLFWYRIRWFVYIWMYCIRCQINTEELYITNPYFQVNNTQPIADYPAPPSIGVYDYVTCISLWRSSTRSPYPATRSTANTPPTPKTMVACSPQVHRVQIDLGHSSPRTTEPCDRENVAF